jgi:MscS family membrane protein
MEAIKEFFTQKFYHNSLLDWAISFGIILGAIIVAKVLYWVIGKYVKKITAKTKTQLDDILVDKLEEPVIYAIAIIGFFWAFNRLTLGIPEIDVNTGKFLIGEDGEIINHVQSFFDHIFTIVFTLNITWLIVRTFDALIQEYLVPIIEKSESDLDDQLMPTIRKVFKIVLWAFGIIIGLNNAGFDVAALIAGLGIGGLAFALAAKDTVANIFGGIMVFIDKPFKPYDRIIINGIDGTVEEVGIRSTRIRTLAGRLVTIPNGQFSDNAVENVTLEPSRKITINLGLAYETTPDQMDNAMLYLREIAEAHEHSEEKIIVGFNAWGDFAMGIMLIYYVKSGEDNLQVQSDINLAILRKFNENGLEFAYPTQTIYQK